VEKYGENFASSPKQILNNTIGDFPICCIGFCKNHDRIKFSRRVAFLTVEVAIEFNREKFACGEGIDPWRLVQTQGP
jgi:hypothetical protein